MDPTTLKGPRPTISPTLANHSSPPQSTNEPRQIQPPSPISSARQNVPGLDLIRDLMDRNVPERELNAVIRLVTQARTVPTEHRNGPLRRMRRECSFVGDNQRTFSCWLCLKDPRRTPVPDATVRWVERDDTVIVRRKKDGGNVDAESAPTFIANSFFFAPSKLAHMHESYK